MKKLTKIFALVVSLLVVLAVALVVLANVLITPERVKATLLPLAEEHLHRKLDFGEIEVSLFSGITIRGLKVYEQDGREIFVSTDLVRFKYQFLPLLALKVVIDEVRLEKPSIRVVRFKDGQFNFSDLTAEPDKQQGELKSAKERGSAGEQGGSPISLLVSNVLLQDGHLVFLDHVLNDKAPYRYELSAMQLAAKGVSLTGEVPVSAQCQLNGSQLVIDGHVALLPLRADFDVQLQNLDMVAFKPYLQNALPGKLGGLKLNLKSAVSGTQDEVQLKGALSLVDLNLRLDAMPEAPLENARLDVNYDLLLNLGQERLQLRQLGLDYNGIKADVKGEASSLMSELVLDLKVVVPKLQIRTAINAVPKGLVGDVRSLDPAGELSLETHLSGRAADALKLLKTTTVDLQGVQATAGGQRPAFSGRLVVNGEQLSSEGLQLRLGDNHANINLKANHIYSKPVIVKADISSERFLLEPLLLGSAGSAVAADQAAGRVAVKPVVEEIGPFDIPLQATGTITVGKALWQGLVIDNFLAQYELKNNIFNLSRMNGQVAGGSFNNTARVDLGKKGLAYSATLGLKSIQADPLLTALSPKAAGNLLGALDLTFALDGRGTVWQTLSRNLTGDGSLLVADGRLISPGLVNGLRTFLQLSELNDIRFDDFKGQFKVVDGKIKIDSQMLGEKLRLFPKGVVGLDGSLNLGLDTRLSPELSARLDKKGGIVSYLADQDGWTRMPLLLTGSFVSPSFGLDPKLVQEQASKILSNELGRQIDKLFKQPGAAAQPADQPQTGTKDEPGADPAQKLLQDSLQKLFGN